MRMELPGSPKQNHAKDALCDSLKTYFLHVKAQAPVDFINLVMFDWENQMMRVVAQASDTGTEETDFAFRLPCKISDLFPSGTPSDSYVINQPTDDPIGEYIARNSGFSDWSMMCLIIIKNGALCGGIGYVTRGSHKYDLVHQRVIKASFEQFEDLLTQIIYTRKRTFVGPDHKEVVEDRHEFFRQVTLRLCGNLQLETGALHCLQYLSRFMPAHMLSIQKYHEDEREDFVGAVPTVFFNFVDPQRVTRYTKRYAPANESATERAIIVNQPDQDPTLSFASRPINGNWSSLTMFLYQKGAPLGVISLISEEPHAFSEKHRELFSMLYDPLSLALSNNIKHREVIRLKNIIEEEKRSLQDEFNFSRQQAIIGAGYDLKTVVERAALVAAQDSAVLLLGETGVGKEVFANFIHGRSSRKNGPLIKVNCGAIPDTLIDSELFGHEKGAFTGADSQKIGRFERANGGTIFLDEIAELPLHAQVRLLRVLQNGVIERVGGTEPIFLDIRIIAATHRNLEEMVATRTFREDLWFRLNTFPINIPPLRERRADIPILAHHFIQKKSAEMNIHPGPSLPPTALQRLVAYDWPGNVRELENVIERELILFKGETLSFDNLLPKTFQEKPWDRMSTVDDLLPLDTVYTDHIKKVLRLTKGKINGSGGAAEMLKIHPGTLRKRMDKLGISYGWKQKE